MVPLRVLAINAGSSSLKATLFVVDSRERATGSAEVSRIGLPKGAFRSFDGSGHPAASHDLDSPDHAAALEAICDWLHRTAGPEPPDAVAHRVVHGGDFEDHRVVSPEVIEQLHRFSVVDPDHQPQALAAIDLMARRYSGVPQIACFDTVFHRSMPPVARRYPVPRRFEESGVRRYGFHGLSCEYIVATLRDMAPAEADGRIVIAHLGSGASMTAVHHGRSLDTTMGFSPAGGLMMGTRPGDLDPGVLLHALRAEDATPAALSRLVNEEAGLRGVSGGSADLRDLLEREARDSHAADAIALFCYLAKKSLGALVAVLGGLDTLVFTGGIGEHSAAARQRITSGLEELGLSMDAARNQAHAPVISTDGSRSVIRVVVTDENLMLARHARRLLAAARPARPGR